MSNLAKFPTDVLDYGFDWKSLLGTSDTITSATMSATPAGLAVGSTSYFGTIIKATISGGVQGTSYRILGVITTAAGLTLNSEFPLDIRDAR